MRWLLRCWSCWMSMLDQNALFWDLHCPPTYVSFAVLCGRSWRNQSDSAGAAGHRRIGSRPRARSEPTSCRWFLRRKSAPHRYWRWRLELFTLYYIAPVVIHDFYSLFSDDTGDLSYGKYPPQRVCRPGQLMYRCRSASSYQQGVCRLQFSAHVLYPTNILRRKKSARSLHEFLFTGSIGLLVVSCKPLHRRKDHQLF